MTYKKFITKYKHEQLGCVVHANDGYIYTFTSKELSIPEEPIYIEAIGIIDYPSQGGTAPASIKSLSSLDKEHGLVPINSLGTDIYEDRIWQMDGHPMYILSNKGASGNAPMAGIDSNDNIVFLDEWYDCQISKFDKNLNYLWTSTEHVAYDQNNILNFKIDSENNFIITKWSGNTPRYDSTKTIEYCGYTLETDSYICLIKFDANGNFLWETYTIGRIPDCDAYYWNQNLGSIALDSNDNIYGIGYYQDVNLYKFDKNGNFQWGYESWEYPETSTSKRWSFMIVGINNNDEICVFGDDYEVIEYGVQAYRTNFWKFDTNGNLIYEKVDLFDGEYIGGFRDHIYDKFLVDDNNNMYILRDSRKIVKLDTNGNILKTAYLDSSHYITDMRKKGNKIWTADNDQIIIYDLDLNVLIDTHEDNETWSEYRCWGMIPLNTPYGLINIPEK